MVTKHEAVCIWEDTVGDSGRAPTDEELHTFALAVAEKAQKPFAKLQAEWERTSKAHHAFARNNDLLEISQSAYEKAKEFSRFAKLLKNRLDAKN